MCDHNAFTKLEDRVDGLEDRLCKVETSVTEMRKETANGFNVVNQNIETVSQMMTNMDARLVEEKVKWGQVFRSLVVLVVKAGIGIVCFACGINLTKEMFPGFFN